MSNDRSVPTEQAGATFEKYKGPKRGRGRGCPRCRKPGKGAGVVTVRLQALGPTGTLSGATSLDGRSRSFCEPCSVAVYEAILAAFDAAMESA